MKTMHRSEARVLRRRGYSLAQLSTRLNISKSTASLWTKDVELSGLGTERLRATVGRAHQQVRMTIERLKISRRKAVEEESERLIRKITKNPQMSLVILSMIYECEGSKDRSGIRFTNSDPDVIKLFLKTLRSVFLIQEHRLKVRVHIHDYQDDTEIKRFWSDMTEIPLSQFYSSFQKPSNHIYKKEGYKGCVNIAYYDSYLGNVLRLFAKKLIKLYI